MANNNARNTGAVSASSKRGKDAREEKVGIFQSIINFVRLVIGELKKVVWPTRKELWTYFWVVIIFVLILMTAIFLFDTLFAWVTKFIFA